MPTSPNSTLMTAASLISTSSPKTLRAAADPCEPLSTAAVSATDPVAYVTFRDVSAGTSHIYDELGQSGGTPFSRPRRPSAGQVGMPEALVVGSCALVPPARAARRSAARAARRGARPLATAGVRGEPEAG